MRESFIFYKSFYDAIKDLPRDIQGEIYTAIMEYSLYGNETDNLKPVARSIFTLIKPQIDVNNKRFQNGRKGGRPIPNNNQTETKEEPNNNQTITKPKPNVNENVTDSKENPPIGGTKKDAALAAILSRKEDFYQSLIPFVDKYPKDMIRAFFDYWSEMNKSCTKMRFEQQPTWEVAKRLATWASRNNQFNRDNGTNRKNYPTSEQRAADAASIIARLAAEDDAAGK